MKNTYHTPTTKEVRIAPHQLIASTSNAIDINGRELRFNKSSVSEGSIDDAV